MKSFGLRNMMLGVLTLGFFLGGSNQASAVLLTDPDDLRTWQGASIGTFAQLVYGSNTLANRQQVISNGLLDDGVFNPQGIGTGSYYGNNLGCSGFSFVDGTYNYSCGSEPLATYTARANELDWEWIQDLGDGGSSWTEGNVWDLGGLANQVVVFPIVDHGPLPQEAIEYTVYLSNNKFATTLGTDGSQDWVQALLDLVYLEGWDANQIADGFTTVWRLPTQDEFRYVNVFAGGPGALFRDGDDELDAVAGLHFDNTPTRPTGNPTAVPEPATLIMSGLGLLGYYFRRTKVTAS